MHSGRAGGVARQNRYKYSAEMIGIKFNDWTLIEFDRRVYGNSRYAAFLCRCKCGAESWVRASSLTTGSSTGCMVCSHEKIRSSLRKKINGSSLRKCHFGIIPVDFWYTVMRGARSRGIDFEVCASFAAKLFQMQNGKCALSGLNIQFGTSLHRGQTASLDRINSKIGYKEGNIQWLHKVVNRAKQEYTQDEFIDICCRVAAKTAIKRTKILEDSFESLNASPRHTGVRSALPNGDVLC